MRPVAAIDEGVEAGLSPSVVVVDRHVLFRSGLVRLLREEGIDVVGEAASGATALAVVAEKAPDVVVLDLGVSDLPGIEVSRRLLEVNPRLNIVAMASADGETDAVDAIVAGACCCLAREAPREEILKVIGAAARGELSVARELVPKLVDRARATRSNRPAAPPARLNKRELDVLRLLVEGCDNREIAARLFISPTTAKHHVSSIIAKLGVANRIQAAVRAVSDALV
jgi:DNA-binding NarL/FixJ family response regulator